MGSLLASAAALAFLEWLKLELWQWRAWYNRLAVCQGLQGALFIGLLSCIFLAILKVRCYPIGGLNPQTLNPEGTRGRGKGRSKKAGALSREPYF